MYSNAYYNRGLVYLKQNHLQYAKIDFEKAIQYDHQNNDAKESLKSLKKELNDMYDTTLPSWMLETE